MPLDSQPKAQAQGRKVKADADYDAARKRCAPLSGEERRMCRRNAKLAHDAALGQLKKKPPLPQG